MPELPEVETIRRVLSLNIKNKIIDKVVVNDNIILEDNENIFVSKLKDQQILDIKRYGKYLLFIFNDFVLSVHLRMEGKFYYAHDKLGDKSFGDLYSYNKHNHILFYFKDHTILIYNDTRKFGKMKLLSLNYMNDLPLSKLGKEPFSLTKEELFNKLKNRNVFIKNLLLDQTIICGLGNIYVDETLNKCKISPLEKGKNISLNQCDLIIKESIKILNKSIELGGSTIHSFKSNNGIDGRFQNELRVYGRNEQTCFNCGHYIVKTFVNGRGTCFCPVCQNKVINKKVNVVGLTGLIGSGKSSVSSYLKSKNIKVIDADKIVSNLYLKDNEGYNVLKAHFNNIDIFNNEGIDKNKLRNYVLSNNKINELNEVILPVIKKEIVRNITDEFCFLDVPLLYESGLDKYCDLVVVVSINKEKQIERLIKRNNMPINDAIKLLKNQKNKEDLYYNADVILDNNFDINSLYKQIDDLLEKIGF